MKNESDTQLVELEAHLAGTLKHVTPPTDLVQRLRQRIRFPEPRELRSRFGDWNRLFLIYGGVMSGMLVIITIARALFYFYRKEM
jgi:hypothetical protein